jgi:hypothetical protein
MTVAIRQPTANSTGNNALSNIRTKHGGRTLATIIDGACAI